MTRTLEVGVKLLGAMRLVYPEVQTFYAVSGAMYQHVVDGTLEVANVQPVGMGEKTA